MDHQLRAFVSMALARSSASRDPHLERLLRRISVRYAEMMNTGECDRLVRAHRFDVSSNAPIAQGGEVSRVV